MAAPAAAGVAGIVWSPYPQCTNRQIRDALGRTARDLGAKGRDEQFGHGMVQAQAALDYLAKWGCKGAAAALPAALSAAAPAAAPAPAARGNTGRAVTYRITYEPGQKAQVRATEPCAC
jgi:serine protease